MQALNYIILQKQMSCYRVSILVVLYVFVPTDWVILIIEFSYKAEFRAKNSRKYEKKKLLHLHFQQTRNNTASPPTVALKKLISEPIKIPGLAKCGELVNQFPQPIHVIAIFHAGMNPALWWGCAVSPWEVRNHQCAASVQRIKRLSVKWILK